MPASRSPAAGLLLMALTLLPVPAHAESAPAPAGKTLSPYFVVAGGESGVDALPLEATSATVEVSGVIARVTVEQRYANKGTTPLNARYVFPAGRCSRTRG